MDVCKIGSFNLIFIPIPLFYRAKIIEEDPTNRFSIGEAFLMKNKNNTETVVVPESVLETPPPPPPPPQPIEADPISHLEIIPEKSKSKKSITVSSTPAPVHSFDQMLSNPREMSSLQSDVQAELQPATASQSVDPTKYCKLCDISVTSDMHMRLHLAGAKHAKKLRQLGEPPYTEEAHTLTQCILDESILNRPKMKANANVNANGNAGDSVATATPHIDYSVFRTPSGQYYCQVCDLSVTSEVTLSQHFASKRHLKTTKRK